MRTIVPKKKSYITRWREHERKLAVTGFFPLGPKNVARSVIGKGTDSNIFPPADAQRSLEGIDKTVPTGNQPVSGN